MRQTASQERKNKETNRTKTQNVALNCFRFPWIWGWGFGVLNCLPFWTLLYRCAVSENRDEREETKIESFPEL